MTANVCKLLHYGNSKAPILVVLDPVIDNDNAKYPITKHQFNFLGKFFKEAGIKKDQLFLVSCSAPCDRETWDRDKLLNDHLKKDRNKLVETIRKVKPKLIICAGKSASRQVFGRAVKITKIRGIPFYDEAFKSVVLPLLGLYHVMRMPDNERLFSSDMQTAGSIVRAKYDLDKLSSAQIEKQYRWCTNLRPLLLKKPKSICVDVETKGKYWHDPKTKVLTVQICYAPGKVVIVPIDYKKYFHKYKGTNRVRTKKLVVAQLKQLLEDPEVKVTGHSLKFDWIMLKRKLGIEIANYEDDTILLMHAVDENMQSKSLDDCVRVYVPEMSGYADQFNQMAIHEGKSRMDKVDPDDMLLYGCGDADAGFRLRKSLSDILKKDTKAYNCYRKVSVPAIRAFCDIEQEGFPINRDALVAFEKMLRKHHEAEYVRLLKMIPNKIQKDYAETGVGLKLTRPALLKAFLFKDKRGLKYKAKVFTPSGQESVSSKDHLPYFLGRHPFVEGIMQYIKDEKLLSTYVAGFYKHIHDGRITPSYMLHRAVTGRTSSEDPNGQNFPKRGKFAKQYRKIFEAPKGFVFIEVDYAQIELKLVAIMAMEETMLEVYLSGGDIHTETAIAVNGITEKQWKELPKEEQGLLRFRAKAVNFGFIYGMWWPKFRSYAKTDYGIDFTDEEAKAIREMFFEKYDLQDWHDYMSSFVKEHGYVRAFDGRVRHLPNVFSDDEGIAKAAVRQAINSPIQAFASDLGLMALARVNAEVPKNKIRLCGFIHDALVALVPKSRAVKSARLMKKYMESNPLEEWFDFVSPIPITADVSIGENLSAMEEIDEHIILNKDIKSYKQLMKAA